MTSNEDVEKPFLRGFSVPRKNGLHSSNHHERCRCRCLRSAPRRDRCSDGQRRRNSHDRRADRVLLRAFFEGAFFYSLNEKVNGDAPVHSLQIVVGRAASVQPHGSPARRTTARLLRWSRRTTPHGAKGKDDSCYPGEALSRWSP